MRAFILLIFSASIIGFSAPQSIASSPPFESGDIACLTITESVVTSGSDCNGSISIPEGVTTIGINAFLGATGLVSLNLPNSVTTIEAGAFQGTTALTSILIPNSVTSIGSSAFQDATAITSISIPNSVTEIANWTFYRANSLNTITIPNSVTSIGEHAFQEATALTSITIPNSVTLIGKSAFESATALTSITLSEALASLPERIFFAANSLTTVSIPESVTAIGVHAFMGATSLRDIRFLGQPPELVSEAFFSVAPGARALVNRSQYESYTAVFTPSPSNWSYLTLEMYMYPSVDLSCLTRTSAQILNGIDCVGPITIPGSVVSIEDNAFSNADSLTSITLPSALTSIGARAFESATSLSLVRLLGAAPTVGTDAFLNVASGTIARIDQVHQSSYELVDGLWNGLILEVIIPPVSNTTTSGNAALDREIERLREAEKKLARANLVTLARGSAPLTFDLFNQASISGVTAKNFAGVAAEIAELPIDRRSQIDEILKIARKFEVVDKVASSDRIYSSMLQEVGLISQDSKHKAALTAALRKLPGSERSSYLAIKQAIDAQMTEIQTRKTRLSEVAAQIAARRKG